MKLIGELVNFNRASKHAGRSHRLSSDRFETILFSRHTFDIARTFIFLSSGFSSFARAEDHLLFKEKAFQGGGRSGKRNPTVTLRIGE